MTQEQKSLLTYIAMYVRNNRGMSPSYTEMQNALGLQSKSGVNRLVVGLDQRGMISRVATKARSIYPTEAGLALLRGDLLGAARDLEAQNG